MTQTQKEMTGDCTDSPHAGCCMCFEALWRLTQRRRHGRCSENALWGKVLLHSLSRKRPAPEVCEIKPHAWGPVTCFLKKKKAIPWDRPLGLPLPKRQGVSPVEDAATLRRVSTSARATAAKGAARREKQEGLRSASDGTPTIDSYTTAPPEPAVWRNRRPYVCTREEAAVRGEARRGA